MRTLAVVRCGLSIVLVLTLTHAALAWNFSWDQGHMSSTSSGPGNPTPSGNSDNGGRGQGGGDEVDLATGNFTDTRTDITIPARGQDLVLSRTYHTQEEYVGPFGRRWHCNWDA